MSISLELGTRFIVEFLSVVLLFHNGLKSIIPSVYKSINGVE